MSIFENRVGDLRKSSFDIEVLNDIDAMMNDFGLVKLKVFSETGEIIFSTDRNEMGQFNTEPYFWDAVAKGNVYSRIVKENAQSLEHQKMPTDVVETYVPLTKNGAFLGAFEVYYDIKDKKYNLDRLLLMSFAVVFVLGLLLLLASVVTLFKERRFAIERERAGEERERLILELQGALSEIKVLSGLIPICSSCKKIRDDRGYWTQVEVYISNHSNAMFSHSICPQCARELYPEIHKQE